MSAKKPIAAARGALEIERSEFTPTRRLSEDHANLLGRIATL
jgi:hypothetical protein